VHGSSSSGPLRAFEASLTKDHDESETGAHLDTLLRSAGSYGRCARVVNRTAMHDVIGKLSR